jgi:tRNA (guanine37-N1)-methyltransferase
VKFDIVTIFPGMVEGPLQEGIVARARANGLLDIRVHDLRDFTTDRHRVVDDVPFGGGPGMVLKPEPLFAAVEAICARRSAEAAESGRSVGEPAEDATRRAGGRAVVLTSPDGELLTHDVAVRLSALDHVVILCGRYEGVDERVREHLATDTISIGDYVVSGGELPALVIVDAVARLVPGVVGDEASVAGDSFARSGLLDYPQYTRPAEFRGMSVPPVLLSGHHAEIERWRREQALARTRRHRPDLLADANGVERAAKRERNGES